MAKTTGPLLSLEAAGTLAGQLTFRRTKRGVAAYAKPTPSNPKTGDQVALRAMVAFLTAQWAQLGSTIQATWAAAAAAASQSPYHQYLSSNLKAWTQGGTPTAYGSSPPTIATPTITGPTATGGIKSATLTWHNGGLPPITWGTIVYRSTILNDTLRYTTIVGIHPATAIINQTYLDNGVAPGTYYYHLASFNQVGGRGPGTAQRLATIT